MADKKKKNPDQVKVSLAMKRIIEDESTRLSREEGRRVTQGEFVRRAVSSYLEKFTPNLRENTNETAQGHVNLNTVTEENSPWFERMNRILSCGNTVVSEALKQILIASDLIASVSERELSSHALPPLDIDSELTEVDIQAKQGADDTGELEGESEQDRHPTEKPGKRVG